MLAGPELIERRGHVDAEAVSDERTQTANRGIALRRLQAMVDAAAVEPKERLVSLEPPERVKEERKREKKHHAQKKQSRRSKPDL